MSEQAVDRVLKFMRENPKSDLYVGKDGFYYVSYSEGALPVLTQSQVDEAIAAQKIRPKWQDVAGFYVLTGVRCE